MSLLVEGAQVKGVREVASKRAPGERVIDLIYEFDHATCTRQTSHRARPNLRPELLVGHPHDLVAI